MFDPQLLRLQSMFEAMQQSAPPAIQQQQIPLQQQQIQSNPMPQRLGQTEPLGGMPEIIQPSQIAQGLNPETEEQYMLRRMQELYSPQTTAQDRLQQLIGQYPTREKPGFLQKLTGSLIGGARGPEAADRAMFGDFYRRQEDWENQVRPVEYAANQERYLNQNQRQFADQVIRRDLDERKFAHKQSTDEQNIKIREKRAAAYDFKQRNPNRQIKVDQTSGNLIAINPLNPADTVYVTGPDGRPISGRDLSFEDRQNILQENRLEAITKAGEVGLGRIEAQGAETRETKLAPNYDDVNPTPPKAMTPSEQRTNRTLQAEQLLDEHPDWEQYLTFDGARVTIKPETPKGIKNQIESALRGERDRTKTILDQIGKGKDQEVRSAPSSVKPQSTKPQSVVAPSGVKTSGPAPPIQQRKVGQEHTFPNGNVGRWDGSKWVPIKVVTR